MPTKPRKMQVHHCSYTELPKCVLMVVLGYRPKVNNSINSAVSSMVRQWHSTPWRWLTTEMARESKKLTKGTQPDRIHSVKHSIRRWIM